MIFDRNENKEVLVLLGGGVMATAIARQIGAGKEILLGMPDPEKLEKDAEVLRRSGYDVMTKTVDAMDKNSIEAFAAYASTLGEIKYFIDSAGPSPNQASPEHIIQLDLVGTAWALDAFGPVMANGGAGLVISSQAGHMMPMSYETEQQLATVPAEHLTELDIVKHTAMERSGNAYMVAKRCNHLRVRTAAATTWGDRGTRINTISPGIIVTPLAYDEFHANGAGYQAMIDASPAKRVGTADEIAELGAFLLSDKASFITGTDILIDGGVIAAMNSGRFGLTSNR
ncbi:MAG: SDR family oxidoreductase [Clostridiales bacterium]|nr:SDR family oxidoreductase [Clostridiales bacterium]